MRPMAERVIRNNWASCGLWYLKGFDSADEFRELGNCFACGMSNGPLSTKTIENTNDTAHLLCRTCLSASEELSGSDYWLWFFARTTKDTLIGLMTEKTAKLFLKN